MNFKDQPITPGRIKTLFTLGNKIINGIGLYFDIDQFKEEFLYANYGVSSTKQLTVAQADDAIKRMQDVLGDDKNRISFGQKQKIEALQALLGMNQKSLWTFIRKQTGFNRSVTMLDKRQACMVIVGLQRIYAESNNELYQRLNRAGARYLRSAEGKAELQLLRKRALTVKSMKE